MLTDPTLPPHVSGGLRAVAAILSPSSPPVPARSKPSLMTTFPVNELKREEEGEAIPYTGERPTSFSKRGRRNVPPSILRRMSTSTWSTTTSATGMPTVEPEPSRKRCASFRNTPGLSSPNTANAPSITSPVNPYPIKARSYSTTALPMDALMHFQEKREAKTPFDLYSFDSNISTLSSSGEVGHRENEPDVEEEAISAEKQSNVYSRFATRQPKQNVPRFNLTSDYDSSNDSPSGSEATIDDSVLSSDCASRLSSVNKRQLISNFDSGRNVGSPMKARTERNECSLCGCKLRHSTSTMKERTIGSNLEPVWPNISPQPPVVPNIDQFGRHLIDDTAFDLDEIASDQLLNRIQEWDYPIFELQERTGDTILTQLSYRIFFEAGLLDAFKIPIPEFLNYFRALEQGYKEKPCK